MNKFSRRIGNYYMTSTFSRVCQNTSNNCMHNEYLLPNCICGFLKGKIFQWKIPAELTKRIVYTLVVFQLLKLFSYYCIVNTIVMWRLINANVLYCFLWFLYILIHLIEFYKFWTFCVVDFTKYGVWNVDLRIWFKYINIYTQRSIEKMHQSHVDNKKRLLLGSILQIYCYRLNFAGTGAVMVPVCHLNLNLAVEST